MSLQDSVRVPAYILILAITCFLALFIWIEISNVLSVQISNSVGQGLISAEHNATIQGAIGNVTTGIQSFDYVFPIIVIGLMLLSLIFAWKSGAGIIYSVLSVIFWGVALMFAAIFSNIFEQFAASFPTISAQYIIITWIMLNMKWIVLSWVFLISIVMFTRNREDNKNQFIAPSEVAYNAYT